MKNILPILLLFCAVTATAAQTLWQENFDNDGTLQDNGFSVVVKNPKDSFAVKNKEAILTCSNAPYKGLLVQKKVQLAPQSEFTFEAKIAAHGTEKFSLFGLKMELGNLLISFRDKKLWIHRPKKNDWIQPGKIKYNAWQKYKIRLDASNRTAEYYIDDMDIPVFVDEKSDFDPTVSNLLKIGNYGLSSGTVICALRNLKYTKYEKAVNAGMYFLRKNLPSTALPKITVLKSSSITRKMNSPFPAAF
ncbi:MAG: hypothetical protein IKB77_05705 [Lentisphaeria bacterium]|nr:hypothetical protein [Lentisphaeria bacterium]